MDRQSILPALKKFNAPKPEDAMRKIGPLIGIALSVIAGIVLTLAAMIYFAFRPSTMTTLSDPEQVMKRAEGRHPL
jgi:hypothetical protein